MNKKIEARENAADYLDKLKNSIARWHYFYASVDEYEGELVEPPKQLEISRLDAAREVQGDLARLHLYCIKNEIEDDFRDWTDFTLAIGTYEIRRKHKVKVDILAYPVFAELLLQCVFGNQTSREAA